MSREWTLKPIPTSFSRLTHNRAMTEEQSKRIKAIEKFPFAGNSIRDYTFGSVHRDADTQEAVFGLMAVGEATWQAMATHYPKGYLKSNIAHHQQTAMNMLPLEEPGGNVYDLDKYDGTLLEFNPHAKKLIKGFAKGTRWNWVKTGEDIAAGKNPIDFTTGFETMDWASIETPEDLWLDTPPEGWNVKEALEQLREINPSAYDTYIYAYGTEEALFEETKDARIGSELFWMLGTKLQMNAINSSIAKNFDEMNAGEEFFEQWIKGLVINGIINDPDMPASMALGIGLSAATWGLGVPVALVYNALIRPTLAGIKYGKNLKKIHTFAALAKTGSKMSALMPENIGPATMRKLFKNFESFSFRRQVAFNAGGNIIEGGITGALAETGSQTYKQKYGLLEDYNAWHIFREGLFEAGITPFINPTIGRIHNLVFKGPPKAAMWTVDKITPQAFSGRIQEWVAHAMNNYSPAALDHFSKMIKKRKGITEATAALTGTDLKLGEDSATTHVLETLQKYVNADVDVFVDKVDGYLLNLVKKMNTERGGTAYTSKELGLELAKSFLNDGDLKFDRSSNKFIAFERDIQNKLSVLESAQKNNLTYEEELARINAEGDWMSTYYGTNLEAAVMDKMGGKEKFDKATDLEKSQVASELIADELISIKQAEEDGAKAIAVTTGKINENIEAIEKVTGPIKPTSSKSETTATDDTPHTPPKEKITKKEEVIEEESKVKEPFVPPHKKTIDKAKKTKADSTIILSELKAEGNKSDTSNKRKKEIKEQIKDLNRTLKSLDNNINALEFEAKKYEELTGKNEIIIGLEQKLNEAQTKADEARERVDIQAQTLRDMHNELNHAYQDIIALTRVYDEDGKRVTDAVTGVEVQQEVTHDMLKPGDLDILRRVKSYIPEEGNANVIEKFKDFLEGSSESKNTIQEILEMPTEKQKEEFAGWKLLEEHGNKTVDENGLPLIVYHGSRGEVDTMDVDLYTKEDAPWSTGTLGKGAIYVSTSQEHASEFGDNVYVIALDRKNPLIIQREAKAGKDNQSRIITALLLGGMDTDLAQEFRDKLDKVEANYTKALDNNRSIDDKTKKTVADHNAAAKRKKDRSDLIYEYVQGEGYDGIWEKGEDFDELVLYPDEGALHPGLMMEIPVDSYITADMLKVGHREAMKQIQEEYKEYFEDNEYKEFTRLAEEANEARIAYKQALGEEQGDALKVNGILFNQLKSQQAVFQEKQKLRTILKAREDMWAELWEESTGGLVNKEKVYNILPNSSTRKTEWTLQKQEGTWVDNELSLEDVSNWIEKTFDKERTRIDQISLNDIPASHMPKMLNYLGDTMLHQLNDIQKVDMDYSQDFLAKNITPGTPLNKKLPTVKESLEMLEKLYTEMSVFERDTNSTTVSSMEIRKWLEGTQFENMGLSPAVLLKNQIAEGQDVNADTDLINLWESEVFVEFDLNESLGYLDSLITDAQEHLGGTEKELSHKVAGTLLDKLMSEGNPNGAYFIKEAAQWAYDMYDASRPTVERFANTYGYIYSVDERTGFPSDSSGPLEKMKTDAANRAAIKYEDLAKKAMRERLEEYLSREGTIKHVEKIAKEVGYVISKDQKKKQIANDLVPLIVSKIQSLTPEWSETWSLRNWGNGKVDWFSPTEIGNQYVDKLATGKGGKFLVTKRRKISLTKFKDGTYGMVYGNEESIDAHESTGILPLIYGQENAISIVPTYDKMALVENTRARSRWEFTADLYHKLLDGINEYVTTGDTVKLDEIRELKQEFDTVIRRSEEDTAEDKEKKIGGYKLPNPIPVEDRLGAVYFPWLLASTVETPLPTRNDLLDLAMYYMTDLPNVSDGFIMDAWNIAKTRQGMVEYAEGQDTHLKLYQDDPQTPSGKRNIGISFGESLVTPKYFALRSAVMEAIGPAYENLFDITVKQAQHLEEQYKIDNPDDAQMKGLYKYKVHGDASASVHCIRQAFYHAKNPKVKKKIQQIRNLMAEERYEGEDFDSKLDGLYEDAGIFVMQKLQDPKLQQADERWNNVNAWKHAFRHIKDVTDLEGWYAVVEKAENSGDQQLIDEIKLIREFFKIPSMRAYYEGGPNAFKDDFQTLNKDGDVWLNKAESLGYDRKKLVQQMDDLSSILYGAELEQTSWLIHRAIGMTPELQQAVMDLFAFTDQDKSSYYTKWNEILDAYNLSHLDDFDPVFKMQDAIELMVSKAEWIADAKYKEVTDKNIETVKESTYGAVDQVIAKMTEWQRSGQEYSDLTDAQHNELQNIIYNSLMGKRGEFSPARDIALFDMYNTILTGHLEVNLETIESAAEVFGLTNWTKEHMMNIPGLLLHHTQLPQTYGLRQYTQRGLMPDDKASSLNRTVVEYDELVQFVSEVKDNHVGEWTNIEFRDAVLEFMSLDKDNRASLATYSRVDSPMHKIWSKAEESGADPGATVRELLDLRLFLEELNIIAQYAPIPLESYTKERSDIEFMRHMHEQWGEDFERMASKLPQEIQMEIDARMRGNKGDSVFLEIKEKLGQLRTSGKEGDALDVYYRTARKRNEVFKDKNKLPALESTVSKGGGLAFLPLYNQYSYANRGNLLFEHFAFEEMLNEKVDPIQRMMGGKTLESDAVVPMEAFGYPSPWNLSTIPPSRPIMSDALAERLNRTGDARLRNRVGTLYNKIVDYAEVSGISEELQDPQAWAFLHNMLEHQEAIQGVLKFTKRSTDKSDGEIHAIRQSWLEGLNLSTQVSRDMKSKVRGIFDLESSGFEIPVDLPPIDPDLTLGDILSSAASSEDRPGPLLDNTLLWKQIKRPMMDESMIIDQQGNQGEIDWKQTEIFPQTAQTSDFPAMMIVNWLRDAKMFEKLKTFKGGKYAIKPGDPDIETWWDKISWADFHELAREALQEPELLPSSMFLTMELERSIVKEGPELTKKIRASWKEATVNTTDSKGNRYKQKHPFGSLGPWMWLSVPHKVAGDNVKVEITPFGRIQMMMTLTNAPLLQRLTYSKLIGRSLGTKPDAMTGKTIRSMPQSRGTKETIGHNDVTAFLRSALETTDALDVIMGMDEDNNSILETLDPSNTSKVLGKPTRFADLDSYRRPLHKGDLKLSSWLEMHVATVNSLRRRINKQGKSELIENDALLQKVIAKTRDGDEISRNLVIALSVLINGSLGRNGSTKVDAGTMRAFFPYELQNEGDRKKVQAAHEHASSILRDINSWTHEDGRLFNNPERLLATHYVNNSYLRAEELKDVNTFDELFDDFKGWSDRQAEELASSLGETVTDTRTESMNFLRDMGLKNVENKPEFKDYESWYNDTKKAYFLDIETNHDFTEIYTIGTMNRSTGESEYVFNNHKPLSQKQIKDLLKKVERLQDEGFKVHAFNGTSFDWRVMGELSGEVELASRISWRAIDPFDSAVSSIATDKSSGQSGQAMLGPSLKNLAEGLNIEDAKTLPSGLWAYPLAIRARGVKIDRTKHNISNQMTDAEIAEINALPPKSDRTKDADGNPIKSAATQLREYTIQDAKILDDMMYGKNGLMYRTTEITSVKDKDGTDYSLEAIHPTPTWRINTRASEEFLGVKHLYKDWANKDAFIAVGENIKLAYPSDHLGYQTPVKENLQKAALLEAIGDLNEMESTEPSSWIDKTDIQFSYKDIADADSFDNYIDRQPTLVKSDFELISKWINDLENNYGNLVSRKDAVLMRSTVIRMYQANFMNIRDLAIVAEKNLAEGVPLSAAIKTADGEFHIRMGEDFYTLNEIGGGRAPYIFAMELAHIGRLKWMETHGRDWWKWTSVMHSDVGKSTMKKLVRKWHNGVWNADAQKEYNYYLSNVEEFLAAVNGFYLMQSNLDIASELEAEEFALLEDTHNIIKRIMRFVSKKLQGIADIFSSFKSLQVGQHKGTADNMQKLIERTLGWDHLSERGMTQYAENVPINKLLPMQPRFARTGKSGKAWQENIKGINDGQILAAERKLRELVRKKEETPGLMTTAENKRIIQLEGLLESEEVNAMYFTGFTRRELVNAEADMRARVADYNNETKWGRNKHDSSVIDLYKFLGEERRDTPYAVRSEDKALLAGIIYRKIEMTHGQQIQTNWSSTIGHIMNSAAKIPFLKNYIKKDNISQFLVDATVGNTGANRTFNSIFLAPVLLTSLLDSTVGGTSGNYVNTEGVRDITKEINKLKAWASEIMNEMKAIESEVGSLKDKIFGGVYSKETIAAVKDINFQILKNVHYRYQQATGGLTSSMIGTDGEMEFSDKLKNTPIEKHAANVADLLYNQMTYLVKTGQEMGEFREAFMSIVPWQMANVLNNEGNIDEEGFNSFKQKMEKIVRDRLKTEYNSILPEAFYTARLLPPIHNVDGMIQWFKDNSSETTGNRALYNFVADWITKKAEWATDVDVQSYRDTVLGKLKNKEKATIEHVRLAVREIMDRMATNKLGWDGFEAVFKEEYKGKALTKLKELKDIHNTERDAEDSTRERIARIKELSISPFDFTMQKYYAAKPKNHQRVTKRDSGNVVELIVDNIVSRSASGMYFLNDHWAVPNPIEASMADGSGTIRNHLVLHPTMMSEGLVKGIGDKIFEQALLRDLFGIHGDFKQLLALMNDTVGEMDWRNYDGTKLKLSHADETIRALRDSYEMLDSKHDAIRGIAPQVKTNSATEEFLFQVAPGLTKIGYTANIPLAGYTVEGLGSQLMELVGKKNLVGFVRGFFGPITAFSKTRQIHITRDIAHEIAGHKQMHIPDYEKPASYQTMHSFAKGVNKLGDQIMRVAQHTHKGISQERTHNLRGHLTALLRGNNSPLEKLHVMIEKNKVSRNLGIKSRDSKFDKVWDTLSDVLPSDEDLSMMMKEAGVDKGYTGIVKSLFVNGLLTTGTFDIMKGMIQESAARNRQHETNTYPYHSPGEMLAHASRFEGGYDLTDGDQKAQFDTELAIIQGLRAVETGYIREVMVTPNAFDITTKGDWLSFTFELFRRYPVLFINQHLIRKGKTMDPIRWATMLSTLLLLDTVYMLALRASMGVPIEDLLKEFEEDPIGNFTQLAMRWPIFGRYLQMLLAFSASLIEAGRPGGMKHDYAAFIAGEGALSALTGLYNVLANGMNALTGQDADYQSLINGLRMIPFIGDSALRLAFYTAMGDNIQRKKRRSSGSGASSFTPQSPGHVGVAMPELDYNWSRIFGDLMEETMTVEPLKWHSYEAQQNPLFPHSRPTPVAPPQEAVEAPQEAVEAPEVDTGDTGIVDVYEAAQKPGGSELADRLLD